LSGISVKSEILTIYLQYVPFGGRIEGVEAASFAYLHKSSKNLTEAESALLAVLPQSPSRWRPDRFSWSGKIGQGQGVAPYGKTWALDQGRC
jgi:penicillin-binding protein 1C